MIHIIWIGDQSKRPDECISSWRTQNPSYEFRLWGNDALKNEGWILAKEMRQLLHREINGVADVMRWEILYKYGGLAFDADSICIRPLEDWLLEPEVFAVWENELARPGLIACGALGATPKHSLIGQIIKDIHSDPDITSDMAWKKVGPLRLTETWRKHMYSGLTIYPSHYFIPSHFSGVTYSGTGTVFAKQAWGSTRKSYGDLAF
jgi:mannosyltransferase OCH1-like enzyme